MTDDDIEIKILKVTGSGRVVRRSLIQDLWSGYGTLSRYELRGGDRESVVVKHVRLPSSKGRGRDTDPSHRRKVRSYRVETEWYTRYSHRCDEHCRLPHCLTTAFHNDEVLLILEDLDGAGYSGRRRRVTDKELFSALSWLAWFHGTFWGLKPDGLWKTGTYWHLATRTEECDTIADPQIKNGAATIDRTLSRTSYQTLVHGDAKLDNFCFSRDGSRVAAVDYQYVGGGCGMKDVAYFLDSCMSETEIEQRHGALLDVYFRELKTALSARHPDVDALDVERQWRPLYYVAVADFHRFLLGWGPGYCVKGGWSDQVTRRVIENRQTDRGNPS